MMAPVSQSVRLVFGSTIAFTVRTKPGLKRCMETLTWSTTIRIDVHEGFLLDVLKSDRLDLKWYVELIEYRNDL